MVAGVSRRGLKARPAGQAVAQLFQAPALML